MGLSTDSQADALAKYSACDISDALLKLKVPGAGFLPDLTYYGQPDPSLGPVIVAPAFTVLFVKRGDEQAELTPSNIPGSTHWVDLTHAGTFVVLRQPDGQANAVCGGIMALRMKACNAKGVIVVGRARDLPELQSTGLPIWTRGLSTVGSGGGSIPWAVQVPIVVDGTTVTPGDLVVSDPINGVVVIPQDKVGQVLDLLPKLAAADAKVKSAVLGGMSVYDAFKLHRGAI